MKLDKLISLCQKQDREAQEKIYRMYSGKFFSLCLKYSVNYELAKDNLQDGFIKIFQNISQYNGKGSFEGWMTRIIINTALKSRKNLCFLTLEFDYPEEPEIEVEEEILSMEFLSRIIEELPEHYRITFNLYSVEGYSHQDISELLGIPVGTSKSNLARARIKLKERIESVQKSTYDARL